MGDALERDKEKPRSFSAFQQLMDQNGIAPSLSARGTVELLRPKEAISGHVLSPALIQPLFSSSASGDQAAIPAPLPATHLRQKDYSLPVWPDDVVHLGPHPLPGQLGRTQACLKHGVKTVKSAGKRSKPRSYVSRKEKRKQLADIVLGSWLPLGPAAVPDQ